MFLSSPRYKWKSFQIKDATFHFIGAQELAENIATILLKTPTDDEAIRKTLMANHGYGSLVLETADQFILWTDHIRTWPVYYTNQKNGFFISPDAHAIKDKLQQPEINERSITEFMMAGYVTGKNTVYDDLCCLEPGRVLFYRKDSQDIKTVTYYQYLDDFEKSPDRKANLETLGQIMDDSIKRIIRKHEDKTIWVPLSAGLDSRILIAKLHEHGHKDIRAFTYGPRFNFEAIYAKRIADTLGVPWQMIAIPRKTLRHLFESDTRKAFWDYADGLKTIPCMREFSAIEYLHRTKQAKEGDVFLNGQSGDYITGGHIPANYLTAGQVSKDTFFDTIIDKHFDLWSTLKTEGNLARVRDAIEELIGQKVKKSGQSADFAKLTELWEYEGRQICYVVNGQRIYEFFNYDWEMPLWEMPLVEFCRGLPLDQKHGQSLYREYLQDYNYKGLFPEKDPYIWRWPIPMLWVVPAAKIIGLLMGSDTKKNFYSYMRNHGHYKNQFDFFDQSIHRKTHKQARSIISLIHLQWIIEHQEECHIENSPLNLIKK